MKDSGAHPPLPNVRVTQTVDANPADIADRPKLRRALLATRASLPGRAAADAALAAHLAGLLARLSPRIVGLYWPIQDEFDPRGVMADWLAAAPERRAALPEVTGRGQPLRFLVWQPDTPLRAGAYGIPVPEDGETLAPDLLLLPCVGYACEADGRCYRLGYGGGYYDRTLAAAHPRPLAVGVAHRALRLPTLAPQAHDMPLDYLVSDAGIEGNIDGDVDHTG